MSECLSDLEIPSWIPFPVGGLFKGLPICSRKKLQTLLHVRAYWYSICVVILMASSDFLLLDGSRTGSRAFSEYCETNLERIRVLHYHFHFETDRMR